MIGKPFDQATRLANLRGRQAEITEELMPKPEGERKPDSTSSPTSETRVPYEESEGTQFDVAESHVSAFPRPIGLALVTAQVKAAEASSRHRDRAALVSRNELGR